MRSTSTSHFWFAVLTMALLPVFTATAVPVTFQVNMEVQAASGDFQPGVDTVEVHGAFDGWGSGFTLSPNAGNPSVYEGTTDVSGEPGTSVQYKFVINQGGNLVWEVNGVGPNGAQNRAFDLPDTALTLPVAYFNNQSTPPGVVRVTFQVNMEIQELLGSFHPASHTVEVHGSFDGWGPGITLAHSPTDPNVYESTLEITGSAGTSVEYKFVINQEGPLVWEGSVGPGGGSGNRTFILADGEQVLPVVYFDNLSTDPGAGIPVTFRVHMGVQVALGLFEPTTGTLTLAGQFNNWSTTATALTNSPGEPYIYSTAVSIKATAGTSVPFKFVADGGRWEDGDNRTFVLESPSQTLPVLYFNRQADLGAVSIVMESDAQVTIRWTAGPSVRLQSAPTLTGGWADVPDSTGVDSVTVPVGASHQFFRLVGP